MTAIAIYKPHEVVDALAELQLKRDTIRRSVARAIVDFDRCTKNDPATFPGTMLWARTTRGLRDLLKPEGWTVERPERMEATVRPDGRFAIVVATGDEHTGLVSTGSKFVQALALPRTRHAKGKTIINAVTRNQKQLSMDFDGVTADPSREGIQRYTWILLVHAAKEEVRCELSLPNGMQMLSAEEGYVVDWQKRIWIEPIPRGVPVADGETTPLDDEPDIDVDVTPLE